MNYYSKLGRWHNIMEQNEMKLDIIAAISDTLDTAVYYDYNMSDETYIDVLSKLAEIEKLIRFGHS